MQLVITLFLLIAGEITYCQLIASKQSKLDLLKYLRIDRCLMQLNVLSTGHQLAEPTAIVRCMSCKQELGSFVVLTQIIKRRQRKQMARMLVQHDDTQRHSRGFKIRSGKLTVVRADGHQRFRVTDELPSRRTVFRIFPRFSALALAQEIQVTLHRFDRQLSVQLVKQAGMDLRGRQPFLSCIADPPGNGIAAFGNLCRTRPALIFVHARLPSSEMAIITTPQPENVA